MAKDILPLKSVDGARHILRWKYALVCPLSCTFVFMTHVYPCHDSHQLTYQAISSLDTIELAFTHTLDSARLPSEYKDFYFYV